jgi:gluconokinase
MTNQATDTKEQDVQPPFVLALDVGTSSTRALLFDATGAVVPKILSQHTYQLNTSGEGEVSVDADMLVNLVAQTIDEVLNAAGPLAGQIKAVAADTFWHSIVGVDADGHALMPLITWEDTRPRKAAAELRAHLDEAQVHARTGALLHASYWSAKLRWLKATQPDVCSRVAQWLSFGEYLHRRLLGRSVCSLSMASGTGLLVTRAHTWDTELLKVLGVPQEQLPQLGDLQDALHGFASEFAGRWPALRDVPWFPAIGDGAAANIGSGAASADRWALTMGTSSAIRVVVSPGQVEPPDGLWLYLVDARRGLLGGALSEGGNLLAWLENTLKLPKLADAEEEVAKLQSDGHGLTVLPFLSGERSPGWHAEARASIVGFSSHTSPMDLLRACMEALAYQLSVVYDELNTVLERNELAPTIIGSGGAILSSRTLREIIADTLNAPIHPLLEREASARGAALLALEALGVVPDVTQVPTELAEPVLPDAERHGIYASAVQRQMRLYHMLLDTPVA